MAQIRKPRKIGNTYRSLEKNGLVGRGIYSTIH